MWLNVKESACQAEGMGLIPESGKFSAEGNGYPLQCSYLGNPMDKKPGGLQSMGLPRVGHNLALTTTHEYIYINIIN